MHQVDRESRASDTRPREAAGARFARSRALSGFPLAVQFLTVVPVPARWTRTAETDGHGAFSMTAALPWFPVVGALLGITVALLDRVLALVLGAGVRAVADLATLALVSGLLHLDGFIDCCDALLGARTVERRLDILRDSRVGAYGVAGGMLLLLGQYAALAPLPGATRTLTLIVAPLLGRCAMVYAVARYPYARGVGAGSGFRGNAGHLRTTILVTALLLVIASLMLFARNPLAALALAVSLALVAGAVTLGWTRWAGGRLGGGLTGDTYGALNELVTLATFVSVPSLLALCLHIG